MKMLICSRSKSGRIKTATIQALGGIIAKGKTKTAVRRAVRSLEERARIR